VNKIWSYRIAYQFNDEPRETFLESEEQGLPIANAAMHLLQLHFGDAENSLIIPSADAADVEVLRQAELLGIANIEVETPS